MALLDLLENKHVCIIDVTYVKSIVCFPLSRYTAKPSELFLRDFTNTKYLLTL